MNSFNECCFTSIKNLSSSFFINSFGRMLVGWLFVWVLCHTNLWRLFNAKSIFMKIVLFQTIQFCC